MLQKVLATKVTLQKILYTQKHRKGGNAKEIPVL